MQNKTMEGIGQLMLNNQLSISWHKTPFTLRRPRACLAVQLPSLKFMDGRLPPPSPMLSAQGEQSCKLTVAR